MLDRLDHQGQKDNQDHQDQVGHLVVKDKKDL